MGVLQGFFRIVLRLWDLEDFLAVLNRNYKVLGFLLGFFSGSVENSGSYRIFLGVLLGFFRIIFEDFLEFFQGFANYWDFQDLFFEILNFQDLFGRLLGFFNLFSIPEFSGFLRIYWNLLGFFFKKKVFAK